MPAGQSDVLHLDCRYSLACVLGDCGNCSHSFPTCPAVLGLGTTLRFQDLKYEAHGARGAATPSQAPAGGGMESQGGTQGAKPRQGRHMVEFTHECSPAEAVEQASDECLLSVATAHGCGHNAALFPSPLQLDAKLGAGGFVTHLYRALWQDQQCRAVRNNLPEDVLYINADFSMNLVLTCKREAQPLFYFSRQLSLLVMIIHFVRDGVLVCEHHYFISEDKHHDSDFVQHSLDLLVAGLTKRGLHFKAHAFFTDGGPGHFKSAAAFMGAVSHASRHDVEVLWNWFASSHGKGPWDGAGAVIKSLLRAECLKEGVYIESAADVVALATRLWSQLKGIGQTALRVFYEVTSANLGAYVVTRAATLPGTQGIHSMRVSPVLLTAEGRVTADPTVYKRGWSCACRPCLERRWEECENREYLADAPWEAAVLRVVKDKREVEMEAEESELLDLAVEEDDLVVGSIVAVEVGRFLSCNFFFQHLPFDFLFLGGVCRGRRRRTASTCCSSRERPPSQRRARRTPCLAASAAAGWWWRRRIWGGTKRPESEALATLLDF